MGKGLNRRKNSKADYLRKGRKIRIFGYLSDICEELDIPTPVMLKTHIFNYAKFRTVKFLPRDFTETPEFDKLVIENISV